MLIKDGAMMLAVIFRTLAGMLSIPVDFEADRLLRRSAKLLVRLKFDCHYRYRYLPPAQSVEVATIRFLSSVLSPVLICDFFILSEIKMAGLRSHEEQLLFVAHLMLDLGLGKYRCCSVTPYNAVHRTMTSHLSLYYEIRCIKDMPMVVFR